MFMDTDKSLSESMKATVLSDLSFLENIGDGLIDLFANNEVIQNIPIIGTINGVCKYVKNIHDALFVKKLLAFLFSIKNVTCEKRAEAICKWEQDKNYRGKVGDTLLGMIERCDDTAKSKWLSMLFKKLVLEQNNSCLFMRAEKVLSSISVIDMQTFLNNKDRYQHLSLKEYEPYIGSGLYKNPQLSSNIVSEDLDLSNVYCEITEIGSLMHSILNEEDA